MNIDDLTYGELKQIAALVGGQQSNISQTQSPFVGKYVICRCYSAGVHAGELVSQQGDVVVLKNSRRLWNWRAKSGVALSGVAQFGLQSGCKIDVINPEIMLTGVIETILTSHLARDSINDY
jgi:hypothetical protein